MKVARKLPKDVPSFCVVSLFALSFPFFPGDSILDIMSGDIQTRRGGPFKLKNRAKRRSMLQELEKQEHLEEKSSNDQDSKPQQQQKNVGSSAQV